MKSVFIGILGTILIACASILIASGIAKPKGPWTETYKLWSNQRIVVQNGCKHSEVISAKAINGDGDVELTCVKD